MVSLTAANTRRMFPVSVACVRLFMLVVDISMTEIHTEDRDLDERDSLG
jgi:hypothetical protein